MLDFNQNSILGNSTHNNRISMNLMSGFFQLKILIFLGLKNLGDMLSTSRVDDITPVLDAYTHGLLGMFPCPRYVLGKQSSIALFIQALPEWLGDRILRLLSHRPKPAVCK